MRRYFIRKVLVAGCFVSMFLFSAEGGAAMEITSAAFDHQTMIPKTYTCQGNDINPPLMISDIPDGTQSLSLIVDDPDAPMGTWVHWVVYNIPAATQKIQQDSVPGLEAGNDFGQSSYGGPCPPSGTHRYFFKVYALDINFPAGSMESKKDLEAAMAGHILDKAELIGLYKK